MEKYITIARGFFNFGNTKDEFSNIWNGFSDQLNSLGPPVRTTSEWQKVWNDYKSKVKAKLGHNKKELKSTGGGCNKLYTFSAQEKSVIDILMLREVSQPSRRTFGLSPSNSNVVQVISVSEKLHSHPIHVDPSDSPIECSMVEYSCENQPDESDLPYEPTTSTTTAYGSKKANEGRQEERNRLLKEQTESIKETERHSKEMARYMQTYEIKARQLKLLQDDILEKRKFRKEKLEIKLREIQLKQRKLTLKERRGANIEY